MDMTGKGVVITGASRGIGEATARMMAAAGAQVALLARNGDAVAEIAGEIGPNALAIPCDVARYWEVEAAISAAAREFGSLDVVINNAGVIEPIASLADSDPDAWSQVIDINLKGVFYGMRAAIPQMRKGGTIITISSGAAHNALEGWSHYCTSKAGAAMLTRCAHRENPGLRIMGLSPGTVATQMQHEIKASGVGPVAALEWEDHIPADWPARALMWMCSADADAFAGEEISLRDADIRARIGLGA
ncbi:short-chain dehydrogenase [Thalassobacter stenotrophicus]|mgnify:CR=1 FL=1|uniref:SDR family oxidoreductase n=1 Tax=Thalassobacter TaxID=266808 RepID=UPI00051D133E|nr:MULTISPECIES: SDR family oxidoreductase [Thalassobacter]KGK79599.1 short-chain dehydrogenase [Thalassobacter stenotrophicus]KGL01462.1 short-chain dehydrogenase [Thalassobacter sp. 16PALIMAR09]